MSAVRFRSFALPSNLTSQECAKIEKWKEEDLYIFFLPKYSPQLNPIEILWRKMKYEWIAYEDLESQEQLEQVVQDILNKFGTKYTINFKEQKVSNIFI